MILPASPWVLVGPELSSPNMLWPLGPEGDLEGMRFLEPDYVSLRAYKQGSVGGQGRPGQRAQGSQERVRPSEADGASTEEKGFALRGEGRWVVF